MENKPSNSEQALPPEQAAAKAAILAGGSGPAQCALAILIDYLGDEERARTLYQGLQVQGSCQVSDERRVEVNRPSD